MRSRGLVPAPVAPAGALCLLLGVVACGRIGFEPLAVGPGESVDAADVQAWDGTQAEAHPAVAGGAPGRADGASDTVSQGPEAGPRDASGAGPGDAAEGPGDARAAADGPTARVDAGATADARTSVDLAPSTGGADAPLSTLVGYWRFDERSGATAQDLVGGHHGTLFGFTDASWVEGRFGNALRFSGAQWVRIPGAAGDALAAANQFTISIWSWRAREQPGYTTVLSRQYQSTPREHFGLYYLQGLAGRPHLILNSHEDAPHCSVAMPVPIERWTHLAAVFDGAAYRIYVDGREGCVIRHSLRLQLDRTPVLLGGNLNGTGEEPEELFDGVLDELALYSRALTATEIARIAAGESPPAR